MLHKAPCFLTERRTTMTDLELYKFVNDNLIEWKWASPPPESDSMLDCDVFLFVPTYQLDDFYGLLSPNMLSNSPQQCWLKDGYVAVPMGSICEYHNVDMDAVFPKAEFIYNY